MFKQARATTQRSNKTSKNVNTRSKVLKKQRKIKKMNTHRIAHFSSDATTANDNSTQLPKIPKIKYLQYPREPGSTVCDVLPLLQQRGFVAQTTNMIQHHFQSRFLPTANGTNDDTTSTTTTTPAFDVSKPLPRRTIYAGFDPTASSLHLGNLLVILSLMHFHNAGHQIVALTGGATGMVGDPSGRSAERVLQTPEQVKFNASKIHESLRKLITTNRIVEQQALDNVAGSSENQPIFVDNFDWYNGMNVINFLRDVGKHFRIASMLAKDSVKSRMNNQDADGLSFTEFTYQVLQGYDFFELFKTHNVTVQLGGSDQWGNITAGIDCINRMAPKQITTAPTTPEQQGSKKDKKSKQSTTTTTDSTNNQQNDNVEQNLPQAHGLTLPLLTTSNGVKFGKSMGNAIWLEQSLTSSYQMYQYLLSTTDADCEKFLKVFTFIDQESIDTIMKQHQILPDVRIPQRILASEVVRLLHGDDGVKQALVATKLLFKDKFNVDMSPYMNPGNAEDAKDTTLNHKNDQQAAADQDAEFFKQVPFEQCLASLAGVHTTDLTQIDLKSPEAQTKMEKIETHPLSAVNLAVSMKLVASKAEAKRLIKNGGLYLFHEKITEDKVINQQDLPYNKLLIMKQGQKKIHIAVFPDVE